MINDAAKLISKSMTKWTQDVTNAMERPFIISDVKVVSIPQNTKTFSVDTKIWIDNKKFEPNVTTVIITEGEDSPKPIDIQIHEKESVLPLPASQEKAHTSLLMPSFEDMEASAFQITPEGSLFQPLINELQEQNNTLTEQAVELKSKIIEYKDALEEMEEGFASARLNFAKEYEENTKAEHQALKFENEHLLSDNSEKEKRITELNQMVANLTVENEIQRTNCEELTAVISINANTISDLKLKTTKQKEKIDALKLDNQQLKETLASNGASIRVELESKISYLTKENKALSEHVNTSEEQLKIINAAHDNEVKELKSQLLALTDTNALLSNEVNHLKAQLSSNKNQAPKEQ